MRVGIIGAGIGGACLAHGLRKNGVDVTVFERNAAATVGLPGYGIHINVFGQQAMRDCLPEENWEAFLRASHPIGGEARFYDENLCLLAAQEGVHFKEGHVVEEQRLSISRTELKDVLTCGLSDLVKWEKQFVHYETLQNGRLRVDFADETSEEMDVLVAADGANSKVRKQYLPTLERLDVGVSIIVGRTRLTSSLAASLPAMLIDGSPNSIVPKSTDWMFVSVWRAPVDIQAEAATAEIDSFVVWAYIADTYSYPSNFEDWPPDSQCEEALYRTKTWNPILQTLIKQSDMNSVSLVDLRSMPHLPEWKPSSVTLLGDAIHNMTPMAGVGANTALRDARLLTRILTDAAEGRIDLVQGIAEYEQQMREYANEAVGLSLRNAQNAVDPSKFKRRVFRVVLRIAQIFPPFKRMLFPAGK
jgi:2-polyprenyl-6-methoxyphenol hydroxylase-like FAD-dependent oxidoreductase